MKKFIALLLVTLCFTNLVVPEKGNSFSPVSSQASMQNFDVDQAVQADGHSAPIDHHNECNDSDFCGSHCHFGHCGYLVSQQASIGSQCSQAHGFPSQQVHLVQFITNLFRPPIV